MKYCQTKHVCKRIRYRLLERKNEANKRAKKCPVFRNRRIPF